MKRILLLINFLLLLVITNAQYAEFQWAKSIGWTSKDEGNAITVDAAGNVYTIGVFEGPVDFDPGPGVFKLFSVLHSDIFISKLDASGNFKWAKSMGGALSDYAYCSRLDGSGNIYTTGSFSGTSDFDPSPSGIFNLTSAGSSDIFVHKMHQQGVGIYNHSITSILPKNRIDIAPNPSNGCITINSTGEGEFFLIDELGKTRQTFKLNASNNYATFIENLGNGVYYLTGNNQGNYSDQIKNQKIVVIK